jgi:molybdopterin synthase catalytic subunit
MKIELNQEQIFVQITDHEIDLNVIKTLKSNDSGALVSFLGSSRDDNGITHLEYFAYTEMALKMLVKICKEMISKHSLQRMLIVHRIGIVKVQQDAILMCCVSKHRIGAIRAIEEGMNLIKQKVPIWKKECSSSSYFWKENSEWNSFKSQ